MNSKPKGFWRQIFQKSLSTIPSVTFAPKKLTKRFSSSRNSTEPWDFGESSPVAFSSPAIFGSRNLACLVRSPGHRSKTPIFQNPLILPVTKRNADLPEWSLQLGWRWKALGESNARRWYSVQKPSFRFSPGRGPLNVAGILLEIVTTVVKHDNSCCLEV